MSIIRHQIYIIYLTDEGEGMGMQINSLIDRNNVLLILLIY